MSTEAPYLSHTQCTASANLSATASLSGPNGSGQFLFVKVSGSRTVTVCAANSDVPTGVLQNDPVSGVAANVAFAGVTKIVAGAAITAGAGLMSDTSGRAITQTSTNPISAQALETATAANQIICALLMPTGGIPG